MDYRKMRVKIIKYACITGIILSLLCLLIKRDILYLSGVFLGSAVSCLMFYQMTNSLARAIQMYPAQAQRYSLSQYVMRLTVYAITIIASIKSNHVNEFGTIIGLFSIKIAILYMTLTNKLN